MQSDSTYHTTVLLHEGVDALNVQPSGVYVDATLGAAGHTRRILKELDSNGKLFGFDQDQEAIANAPEDDRFVLCQGNFRYLSQFMRAHGVDEIDGVIADLGVSGHHFDAAERGFSFRFDAPLDMRMNQSQELDAKHVVNAYDEQELAGIFKLYGESSYAKAIARRIVQKRKEKELETTQDLVDAVALVVPERKLKGELPKIFQAIRIEVNQELEALKEFLEQAAQMLKRDGRLVVLSYHSLEDRLVKHFFRSGNFRDKQEKDVYGNVLRILDPLGKAITPSANEIELNPRARSAKMRIAIKR